MLQSGGIYDTLASPLLMGFSEPWQRGWRLKFAEDRLKRVFALPATRPDRAASAFREQPLLVGYPDKIGWLHLPRHPAQAFHPIIQIRQQQQAETMEFSREQSPIPFVPAGA